MRVLGQRSKNENVESLRLIILSKKKTHNTYTHCDRDMERAVISPSLNQNYLLCPSRAFSTRLHSFSSTRNLSPPSSSIKVNSFPSLFFLFRFLNCYHLTLFSDYIHSFSILRLLPLYCPVSSMVEPLLLDATLCCPILPGLLES